MVQTTARINEMMGWLDALSDPTRLRLLRLLEGQELGVAELCDVLQMPQSSVSRHLKLLSEQAWVHNRRHGTSNLYHMSAEELDAAARRLWQLAREQTQGWRTFEQDQLRLARRLRQRQENSQAFFAGAARRWDQLRSETYGSAFSATALLALLPDDMVVADLGCGTGQLTADLAPHVRQVIAVDQSEAMLRAARARTKDLENVELRRGELESLPLESESCDAAMLVLVLSYVSDPAAVLAEMARVLRPGGRGVVVDLLPHDREDFRRQMGQQHQGFERTQLQGWLEQAQLTNIRMMALEPEPQSKGSALQLLAAQKRNGQ